MQKHRLLEQALPSLFPFSLPLPFLFLPRRLTLSLVLERLLNAGFRLNKAKCKFFQSSVVYLGHVIDGGGLHPTQDKLEAIQDAPRAKDVTALKSFLGRIMFHSRFMAHHSTVLAPLHQLLKNGGS